MKMSCLCLSIVKNISSLRGKQQGWGWDFSSLSSSFPEILISNEILNHDSFLLVDSAAAADPQELSSHAGHGRGSGDHHTALSLYLAPGASSVDERNDFDKE
jgi:hypothetical protein